jgi:toxin CcdB
MGQFSVHQNASPATRTAIPYLLDVQSNLIEELGTRVVVPLCPASSMKGKVVSNLMPILDVDGKQFVMLTPQLAGVPRRVLGPQVADLAAKRTEIIAALDFLVLGF